MPEFKANIGNDVLAQFRVKVEEVSNSRTRKSMEQAVDSFARFLGGASFSLADFDEELISEWVTFMFGAGYSYKTVGYYLNILSSLYNKVAKEEDLDTIDCFSAIKERLGNMSAESLGINSITDCFSKLRSLVLTDCTKNPARQLAKDVVLFSLYNGGMPFDKLTRYRKDDYTGSEEAILAIVERYSKPKNKYLFPLNQSERTPNQLERTLSSLFSEALKLVGIEISAYSSSTASDLWANIALQCGFTASEVAGCLEDQASVNPLYSFASKKELTSERKTEIRDRVAQILARDPEDWYAMQFRPYVDYNKVQARLNASGITFSKTFYPMEEIVRRVGKKMKRESRPVMPGLFFFKSKATQLPGLFYRIGDLAWGYRYSRNARGSYAVIPQRAIIEYENAVGQFVDSIDEYPEGTLTLQPGDKVEIVSGEFAGQPAIFEKEIRKTENGKATRLTYRLKLAGLEQYTWTVDLDPRQLQKIPTSRFTALKAAPLAEA